MEERGISIQEIEETLNKGSLAKDVKAGTNGKVLIFRFNDEWEGKFYKSKEVTVYYKLIKNKIFLLTAIARYGNF